MCSSVRGRAGAWFSITHPTSSLARPSASNDAPLGTVHENPTGLKRKTSGRLELPPLPAPLLESKNPYVAWMLALALPGMANALFSRDEVDVLAAERRNGHVRSSQDLHGVHRRPQHPHVRMVGLQDVGASHGQSRGLGDAEHRRARAHGGSGACRCRVNFGAPAL